MKTKYLLIGILLIAGILRLWNLDSIPPHLTEDEASLGYNAYSILKTGRDQYGHLLPIIFKSFGDFSPGLYVYATLPFVALLGLTELAVRLPGALSGVLAVFLIYLVSNQLFRSKRIAIFSAIFLAISPWHIQFSRGAWLPGVALMMTLAGIYFFLRSFKDRPLWIVFSAFLFGLTLLTYQGAKMSTLIVVLILAALYFKKVLGMGRKHLFFAAVVGSLVVLPIMISFNQGKTGRLNVFSIFSYTRPREILQSFLTQNSEIKYDLNYYLFHSECLNFTRGILTRYFNHFSGRFLFFEGDWANPRLSTPYSGVFIFVDLVFIVIGMGVLFRMGFKREVFFVLLWLALAPLPAALSRDSIHSARSLHMVIPLVFISAMGADILIQKAKSTKFWTLIIICFTFVYTVNYFYFLDEYFVHTPKHNSQYWDYGYKQIVEEITPIQANYKKIVIKQSYAQPFIFFLFYQKYDPVKYQKIADSVFLPSKFGDVGLVTNLDNIEFRQIDWPADRKEHKTLFVADPIQIPPDDSKDESQFKIIKEIKYLNNVDTAFRIVEVK